MSRNFFDWDLLNDAILKEEPSVFRTSSNRVPVSLDNTVDALTTALEDNVYINAREGDNPKFVISVKFSEEISSFIRIYSSEGFGVELFRNGSNWAAIPYLGGSIVTENLADDWLKVEVTSSTPRVSDDPVLATMKIDFGADESLYMTDFNYETLTGTGVSYLPSTQELPPLAHNWSNTFTETHEYTTKVTATSKGIESRKALQDRPTRTYTFRSSGLSLEQSLDTVHFLANTSKAPFYLPTYRDEQKVKGIVDRSPTWSIELSSVEGMFVGQRVLLARMSDTVYVDYRYVEIEEIYDDATPGFRPVDDSLENIITSSWSYFPLITCEAEPDSTVTDYLTSVISDSANISGTERDGNSKMPAIEFTPEIQEGLPIFPVEPDFNDVNVGVLPNSEVVNFPAASRVDNLNIVDRSFSISQRNVDRQTSLDILGFFQYCKGRSEAFLFKSPIQELEVLGETQDSLAYVKVQRLGDLSDFDIFEYVYIEYADGSYDYRKILGFSDVSGSYRVSTETDRSQLGVVYATFSYVCRFNSDSFSVTWLNTTHSTCQIDLRSLKYSGDIEIPYIGVSATSPTDIFLDGSKSVGVQAICFDNSEITDDEADLGTLESDDYFGNTHVYSFQPGAPHQDKFSIEGDVLKRTQKLTEGEYDIDVRSTNNLDQFIDQTLTVFAQPYIPVQFQIVVKTTSQVDRAWIVANPQFLVGLLTFELPRDDSEVTREVDEIFYWQFPAVNDDWPNTDQVSATTRQVDVIRPPGVLDGIFRISFRDTPNLVAGDTVDIEVLMSQNGGPYVSVGSGSHDGSATLTTLDINVNLDLVCPL